MRIRTIKPEFWGDEKLAPMDPLTRLVFLGLISMADDAGRLLDSVKLIDGVLFAFSDDTSREALANLARAGRITRGLTASGQPVIQLNGWHHQKVDHPNLKAALPEIQQAVTDDSRAIRENVASDSREIRDSISTSTSTNDQRPTTTPRLHDADVDAVLKHYTTTHPRRRPGEKDRNVVRRALAGGYAVPELCAAIDGNAADPWHRERAKHELTYVLRDNGQIDTFREKVRRPAVSAIRAPFVSPTEQADRLHQQNVAEADRYEADKLRVSRRWAKEHPDEYAPILALVEAAYRGKSGAFVEQAKRAELAQRTAKAAGFPTFEQWQQSTHAGAA